MVLVGPHIYMEEELLHAVDAKLQAPTHQSRSEVLIKIVGDTIHENDGTHLHEGVSVAVDTSW
jgi:metal-responsive CopG/Arc/MetJ family transcriptional regulator